MKKRFLIAGLAAAAVFATVLGLAAAITVTSDSLGAGGDTVDTCDDDVSVSYVTAFQGGVFKVTGVTVSGIADECNGKTLTVQLTTGSGTPISGATGSVTINNSSHTITLTTPAPASQVDDVHIVITG
jgi:ABC-type phosphate transport system substrate-binding protein